MNKYQQTIENIEMSDEMKNRILGNVRNKIDIENRSRVLFRTERIIKRVSLALGCSLGLIIISCTLMWFMGMSGGGKAACPSGTENERVKVYCLYEDAVSEYRKANSGYYQKYSYTSAGEDRSDISSDDGISYVNVDILSNDICNLGFNASNNKWEELLCTDDTVMKFDDASEMSAFTGIDASLLVIPVISKRTYELRINGIVSIIYGIDENAVVFSTASAEKVNLGAVSANDSAVVVETNRGNISMTDDSSNYFAAWWTENGMSFWLYSQKKKTTEWLKELFDKE